MIGDKIHIKPEYTQTAEAILEASNGHLLAPCVVAIGGESGSGKSVTAVCLQQVLQNAGIPASILHQDDYFKLPPKSNHLKRLDSFQWIGPNEVHLDLLNNHISEYKQGARQLLKPVVHYQNNEILMEYQTLEANSVLIVEGTYSLMLQNFDLGIFMERNYTQTLEQRKMRQREAFDPFIEKVLEREHQFIAPLKAHAHIMVKTDYSIQTLQTL